MWHIFGAERVFRTVSWKKAESRLRELNVPFRCSSTANPNEVQSAADAVISDHANRFVAAGGDGAANILINALLNHTWDEPPTVGFLPIGTGCDFNRSFGIPSDPKEAASLLSDQFSGGDQLCDVGLVEGEWGKRYFLNVATIGLTAAAVQRASRLRWFGAARYLFGFWTVLPTFGARRFDLRNGSAIVSHQGPQAVVANGRFFGSGFQVAPQANTNDGELDVMMVAATKWQMARVFQLVRTASHIHSPKVICSRTNQLTIDCETPTQVEVDGDYLGMTPAGFSVLHSAIRVRT